MSKIKDIKDRLGITAMAAAIAPFLTPPIKAAIEEQLKREYREARAKAMNMTVAQLDAYQSIMYTFGDDVDYVSLRKRLEEVG